MSASCTFSEKLTHICWKSQFLSCSVITQRVFSLRAKCDLGPVAALAVIHWRCCAPRLLWPCSLTISYKASPAPTGNHFTSLKECESTRERFMSLLIIINDDESRWWYFIIVTKFLSRATLDVKQKSGLLQYSLPVPKITQNSYCTLLWRAREAEAYNGGLEAEPPAWSRGRAGSWKPFKILESNKMGKWTPFHFFSVLQTAYYQ